MRSYFLSRSWGYRGFNAYPLAVIETTGKHIAGLLVGCRMDFHHKDGLFREYLVD